jgi:N-acetyl-1-D-myo-inositol-2-amino-2-deoxy-alpha-D-glucopyranoside deacetylase
MAALAAHATQVSVDDGFFALSNNLGTQAFGIEYFRIARGVAVVDDTYAAGPLGNVETDLFAGVDE